MNKRLTQSEAQLDFDRLYTQQSLVAFRLNNQIYALPIEPIVQIIEMVTITPIPQVDPVIEGVINVRGRTVPVVKMRRHLGMPDSLLGLHTPIILVIYRGLMVGLVADAVIDVFRVSVDQQALAEEILPEELEKAPILKGLIYVAGEVMLLLDVENLFTPGQTRLLNDMVAKQAVDNGSADGAEQIRESGAQIEEKAEVVVEPKPAAPKRSRSRSRKKKEASTTATETKPAAPKKRSGRRKSTTDT